MARIRESQPLVPSILDRLIDLDPSVTSEHPKSRNQVLRELKASVCRDLENLLNTRRRCIPWPDDLKQLDVSLVNYGIPDFTGASMTQNEERDGLRYVIEQMIRKFEPRFKSVQVTLIDHEGDFDRTLRFRIDGLLYADPAPEPVVFDSQLEPSSAEFEVKQQN